MEFNVELLKKDLEEKIKSMEGAKGVFIMGIRTTYEEVLKMLTNEKYKTPSLKEVKKEVE